MPSAFRLAGLAAPVLMLATACAMPGAPATAPLVGSEWRLEDLGGAAVLDRVEATLGFPEAGRVAGNGSCNRFFGSYTLMSDRIAIGQMGATRMACAGPGRAGKGRTGGGAGPDDAGARQGHGEAAQVHAHQALSPHAPPLRGSLPPEGADPPWGRPCGGSP